GARPGDSRRERDLRLHLPGQPGRDVRAGRPDECHRHRGLPAARALHGDLLQSQQGPDQHRHSFLHGQEFLMTMAPPARSGPENAPDGSTSSSRPRAEDRLTRKRLPLWDRIKLLVMLGILWLVLVWTVVADGGPGKFDSLFADAWRTEVRNARWLIVLIALEVLRQIHFVISEHWAGYNQFWVRGVFGGTERLTRRKFSDWTRFRLWRAFTWVFWIAVLALILGKVKDSSPIVALVSVPAEIFKALPFVLQIFAGIFFVIIQFGALFWF